MMPSITRTDVVYYAPSVSDCKQRYMHLRVFAAAKRQWYGRAGILVCCCVVLLLFELISCTMAQCGVPPAYAAEAPVHVCASTSAPELPMPGTLVVVDCHFHCVIASPPATTWAISLLLLEVLIALLFLMPRRLSIAPVIPPP